MDAYRALVRRLAEKRDPEIISNSSIDHATVLVAEMLRRGQGEAHIFSGALNPALYSTPEVIGAMTSFLTAADSCVKIIVQEKEKAIPNWEIFLSRMTVEPEMLDRIDIRVGNDFVVSQPFHFTTVGSDFFRFEPDREKHEAFASFGRPGDVAQMTEVFEAFWGLSPTSLKELAATA
ncbi:hypothetical protein [Ramlibacter albus]|uniref:DUF7931 domain-containing protein n=1 Tax=Ramlibacter albus TaxID=2079448 RepID=A0A923M7H8_9BURK|nr:hypothetical protein [Ramlibacter albus]MBC5764144.1 hypothetical protein [Ramlibacter albus]